MLAALSAFDDLWHDLFFEDASALAKFRLLEGLDNKSLEVDRALWQLSRRARASAEVSAALSERNAANVVRALERTAEGQAFLAELHAFLDCYGHRGKSLLVSDPNWIEDPAPVIKNLRDDVARPARDVDAECLARAQERERLVAETRRRLEGYPTPLVQQFDFYLKAAQEASVLQEDHNFWIDQRGIYQIRRVLLEFGRRLTDARVLGHPDGVFHLTLAELRETAARLPDVDRRQLVLARKAEIERFRAITPPPALGSMPPGPPLETPLGRAVDKFFGVPVPSGPDPRILRGHPGSAGTVRGPARVVRALAEAARVQPGDVLVAEATMPAWTPLFATVAAVVTDVGGVTSHCAVVAREYGIPAVVGTAVATSAIRDGQIVEVDGSAGVVRMSSL